MTINEFVRMLRERGCYYDEQNAIQNANPADRIGATLYLVGLENGKRIDAKPCLMCQRSIRNARIAEVMS